MNRTLEDVVDLLRRVGPGALPVTQVRRELGRRQWRLPATAAALRLLADNSDGRVLLLEARVDRPSGRRPGRVLVAWMVLMWHDDEPDQSVLASHLWRSLAASAAAVDPACRAAVCRWALQARQARMVLHQALLAGRQGDRETRWGAVREPRRAGAPASQPRASFTLDQNPRPPSRCSPRGGASSNAASARTACSCSDVNRSGTHT